MRFIHLLVVAMLLSAASYVYRIKLESTVRTERVSKLHAEIRKQRDAIAVLRSEWAQLDSPMRLQGLADRHLKLQPIEAVQFDSLRNLPERPPTFFKQGEPDPIGAMLNVADPDIATGSIQGDEVQR